VKALVTELANYERDVVVWRGDMAGPFDAVLSQYTHFSCVLVES